MLSDYGVIVEKFRRALDNYNLIKYDEFSRLIYLSSMNNIGDQDNCEKEVIAQILDVLSASDIPVNSKIIEILYREHNSIDTLNIFRNICENDNDLNVLSMILIKSKKLINPPIGYSYNVDDITSILKKNDNFNLSEINQILIKYTKIMDYLKSYINFIRENGVEVTFNPTIKFIANEYNKEEPIEQHTIKLCYQIAVSASFNSIPYDTEIVKGFAKASITLKFHIDHSFREYACKISSDDSSVAILRAYYTKSREYGRTSPVSINELINDLPLIIKEYENRENMEFKHLKGMLNDGVWYDSSGAFLKEYLDFKVNEINVQLHDLNEQFEDVKESKIFKEVVSQQFINVNITTVEKAIDAQFFGAYIIIFNANREQLAPYVNKLSIRDLENQDERRWRGKTLFEKETIEKTYGVCPKYDFVFYSKNTRIGFLNKNEDFVEFKKSFIDDLKRILKIEYQDNEWPVEMGLAIQKITPAESNLGQLDNDGMEDILSIKNLDFAYYISRLASDHLSPQEQAGLLVLEKNIDLLKIINYKNIYEIIKSDEIKPHEQEALESKALIDNIIAYFDSEYGINNLRRLALDLESGELEQEEITPIVADIFHDYLSSCEGLTRIKFGRSELLAKRFLNILVKFAAVYKVQRDS